MALLTGSVWAGDGQIDILPDALAPTTITAPGSYVVVSDIVMATNTTCILVNSDNVVIDLNGHVLTGNGGSVGINANDADNITIRNGVIRDFGIGIHTGTGAGGRMENVSVSDCEEEGFSLGNSCVVTGCSALDNLENGFECDASGVFLQCVSRGNGSGFSSLDFGSTYTNCTAEANSAFGFIAQGAAFLACATRANSIGFNISGASTLTNCTSVNDSFNGFLLASDSTLTACTSIWSGVGAIGNGIELSGSRNVVSQCNVTGRSAGSGITSGTGDNRIEGNTSRGNGVGISVASAGNSVTDNVVTDNATGIQANSGTSLNNFIARNTASGNTTDNYLFGAGNSFGPIVIVTGVGDINAAAAVGHNHPLANYVH